MTKLLPALAIPVLFVVDMGDENTVAVSEETEVVPAPSVPDSTPVYERTSEPVPTKTKKPYNFTPKRRESLKKAQLALARKHKKQKQEKTQNQLYSHPKRKPKRVVYYFSEDSDKSESEMEMEPEPEPEIIYKRKRKQKRPPKMIRYVSDEDEMYETHETHETHEIQPRKTYRQTSRGPHPVEKERFVRHLNQDESVTNPVGHEHPASYPRRPSQQPMRTIPAVSVGSRFQRPRAARIPLHEETPDGLGYL